MSKAFTKESDGEDDELPEPADEADDDGDAADDKGASAGRRPRYITRAGFDAMRAELERLWHDERPKVTADVQAAAAQGDRSENAEYIYGKKRLREIDRRIRFLSKRLDILVVVDPQQEQVDSGRVYFGAWVVIEDEDEARFTYRIVGGDESDLTKRHISVESPVAKALLGKKVGDVVTVMRPKGAVEVTVVAVSYDLVAPRLTSS